MASPSSGDAPAGADAPRGPSSPVSVPAALIAERYADYLRDESRYGPGRADALYFPTTEEQVAEILSRAQAQGTPVTVAGARTGLVGGAVPEGGSVLAMERLNRFLGLRRDPTTGYWLLRLQPGVSLAYLRTCLENKNLPGLPPHEMAAFRADPQPYFYAPDPTETGAQLGGTVATNASGARGYKYGPTRQHVRALRVVLPTGEILALRRGQLQADAGGQVHLPLGTRKLALVLPHYTMPAVKNAAGFYCHPEMDPIDLFIGSEGTLGVITEVEIQLVPRPESFLSGLAFFPAEEAALAFVRAARTAAAVDPCSLEFLDHPSLQLLSTYRQEVTSVTYPPFPPGSRAAVFFEQGLSGRRAPEEVLAAWETLLREHASSLDQTWAGLDLTTLARLRAIRHALPEAANLIIARAKLTCPAIYKVSTDLAVPDAALETMFRAYRDTYRAFRLDYLIYGHISQNHLHTDLLPKDEAGLARAREAALAVTRLAVSLGGTVSAEHGIGKLKRHLLPLLYGEEGVAEMRALKRALDPAGILNRGCVFPWQT